LLLTGSWQQSIAAASGGSQGVGEVAAASEDGSIKGDGGHNKGGSGFVVPLFLSPLTFSLFTFRFSLLGALEKASQKKKSEGEWSSILANFNFSLSKALEPCYTCCMWAGGTKSQFVVVGNFIRNSHNTCLKFNIRVKL
jgi:hypothetical protein